MTFYKVGTYTASRFWGKLRAFLFRLYYTAHSGCLYPQVSVVQLAGYISI